MILEAKMTFEIDDNELVSLVDKAIDSMKPDERVTVSMNRYNYEDMNADPKYLHACNLFWYALDNIFDPHDYLTDSSDLFDINFNVSVIDDGRLKLLIYITQEIDGAKEVIDQADYEFSDEQMEHLLNKLKELDDELDEIFMNYCNESHRKLGNDAVDFLKSLETLNGSYLEMLKKFPVFSPQLFRALNRIKYCTPLETLYTQGDDSMFDMTPDEFSKFVEQCQYEGFPIDSIITNMQLKCNFIEWRMTGGSLFNGISL